MKIIKYSTFIMIYFILLHNYLKNCIASEGASHNNQDLQTLLQQQEAQRAAAEHALEIMKNTQQQGASQ